jgi:nitrogen fixation protein FixH
MKSPAALWPLAVVAVLAITVGANAWLLWESRDPNGAVIEPDYYRKAVAWDSLAARQARSDGLGWRVDAALGASDGRRAHVRVTIADSLGAPVAGATVELEAVHNLDGAHHVLAALPESAPGAYEADAALDRHGMWELRLTARRGDDVFLARVRRDAAGGIAR